MKRAFGTILIALLLCSLPCCTDSASRPEAAYTDEKTVGVPPTSGIDASLEIARAKELLFRIENGEISGERAQNRLDERRDAFRSLQNDAAIAYVEYSRNVTDEENRDRYNRLCIELYAYNCIFTDAALALSADPVLSAYYDEEMIGRLKREDALYDLSALPLIERELSLISAYEALPATLTIELFGRTWTGDEILSDPTLSEEAFAALYEAYLQRFSTEAGAVFLALVDVRKELAETLGFPSYAEYRYACRGRGFSLQDAEAFSERVKRCFVPILSEMQDDFMIAAGRLSGAVFDRESTMDRIGSGIREVLPELSGPWDEMIRQERYDLGDGPARMPVDFTIRFPASDASYLFVTWTNGFETPLSVIRAFGQYAALVRHGDALLSEYASDAMEIDAWGLELLTVLRYDTIYGDLAYFARTAQLFYTVYALIGGCAADAFERFAYGTENLTPDALNAEYAKLASEYGLDQFGAEGRSWTQDAQLFLSPFHAIGASLGAITGIELYLNCADGSRTACEAYRTILTAEHDAQISELLKTAGLLDPFSKETVGQIAETFERLYRTERNK